MSSPDGNFIFTLAMTGNSTRPPLINAVKVYTVLYLPEPETDQDEGNLSMFIERFINPFKSFPSFDFSWFIKCDDCSASAMVNIIRNCELEKTVSWQGDPCAPQAFRREGLNCTYPDSEPPRIISLYVFILFVHLRVLSVSSVSQILTPMDILGT